MVRKLIFIFGLLVFVFQSIFAQVDYNKQYFNAKALFREGKYNLAMESFKPLKAVFGNIDNKVVQSKYPEDLRFNCEGIDVFITHIGGTPPKYNPRVRLLLNENPPDLFICGHSHILLIKRDPKLNNMLFVNPGAAGNHGLHRIKTLVRFNLESKKISNMEVIELGKRGAIPSSESIS